MDLVTLPEGTPNARTFTYGEIRSLYHTLDNEIVTSLEEASLCCCLRDFKAATKIFDAFSDELRAHPVIAFEHAQLYWLQWFQYKGKDILEKALAAKGRFEPRFNDSGIYTLLRLCRGLVTYHTDGNFFHARDAMREVKSWLGTVPIQDYTDVQTLCVIRYYYLLLLLNNVATAFDFDFFHTIPYGPNDRGPLQLTHLREHLQRENRLTEARSVLDTELGWCACTGDQLGACRSLLDACSSHDGQQPIWYIAGRARLRLAHVLHVDGKCEEARAELMLAEETLDQSRAPGINNGTGLAVRLQDLKDSTPATEDGLFVHDINLLERYDAFSNDPNVQQDAYIFSTALTRALDVALAILEKDQSESNREMFWRWSSKTERLLEEIGDIAHLFINRLATGDIACTLFSDYASVITWHRKFDAKHPPFDLWRSKFNSERALAIIHFRIKNYKQAFEAMMKMQKIAADQDNFWHEEGFKSQAEVSSRELLGEADLKLLPIAFQTGFKQLEWLDHETKSFPGHFSSSWEMYRIKVGSYKPEPSTAVEETLLECMRHDFANGSLGTKDIEVICSALLRDRLGENLDTPPNVSAVLENLTAPSLSTILYGTADSPTPESEWREIFEILCAWLLENSQISENKRHYLLFQLQDRRQSRALYGKDSFRSSAVEIQRLIDLIPRLNAPVREQVSGNISAWRSLLASAKAAIYLQSQSHPISDTESKEFKEVLALYKQSLEENYGNGKVIREIHINVDIAQLYSYAAMRGDQRALDPFFQAMLNTMAALEKLRDGWRALNGWERVYNLLLVLEDEKIKSVIPWTVAVLCKYPDSLAKIRASNIWSMIQIAKSIGLGWLMEINTAIVESAHVKSTEEAGDTPSSHEPDVESAESRLGTVSETKDTDAGNRRNAPSTTTEAEKVDAVTQDVQATKSNDNEEPSVIDEYDGAAAEVKSETTNNGPPYTMLGDVEEKLQRLGNVAGDLVYVDWYDGSSQLRPFVKPLISAISPGQRPQCCLAEITWEKVHMMVKSFINFDADDLQSEEESEVLYELNPLIAPLKNLSKPGQTLIFSPCGDLHRIPLHALKIDGDVLLRRNPIVYCSSLSALIVAFEARQAMEKRLTAASARQQRVPLKVSMFGDPPTDMGKNALHETAAMLQAPRIHIEEDFNADQFIEAVKEEDINLLHYHGHAQFSSASPLDQSLSFSDQELTLREIFDIPPGRRAFHATLLGCGSGASKTTAMNEVIGLGPSLLHAGAASTVSSLWPFSDADAALYSEYFYDGIGTKNFADEVKDLRIDGNARKDESSLWDLALANQRAVLKIMEQKPELYHWAGFVLHGWWMMRVYGQSRERISLDS